MKCPRCSAANLDKAKFFNQCGNKLEIICLACRTMNPPNSRFCSECGRHLQETQHSESVDYSEPQSYTPKFLADKILTIRSSIEGERKLVTVLLPRLLIYLRNVVLMAGLISMKMNWR